MPSSELGLVFCHIFMPSTWYAPTLIWSKGGWDTRLVTFVCSGACGLVMSLTGKVLLRVRLRVRLCFHLFTELIALCSRCLSMFLLLPRRVSRWRTLLKICRIHLSLINLALFSTLPGAFLKHFFELTFSFALPRKRTTLPITICRKSGVQNSPTGTGFWRRKTTQQSHARNADISLGPLHDRCII